MSPGRGPGSAKQASAVSEPGFSDADPRSPIGTAGVRRNILYVLRLDRKFLPYLLRIQLRPHVQAKITEESTIRF